MQIEHTPTGVSAEASERRSQAQNLAVARRRLRVRLAIEVRSTDSEDQESTPSDLWAGRSRGGRLAISREHEDFPALLAEALDALASLDWDDRAAADLLRVSRTQLVRFLRTEPDAIRLLNAARRERGHTELR